MNKKHLFYFAASLSFFCLSCLFTYLLTSENPQTRQNTEARVEEQLVTRDEVAAVTPAENPLHQETGIEALISDKEKALLLFGPTIRKWLAGEDLTELNEPSPAIAEKVASMRLHRYEAPYVVRMAEKSYKSSLVDLDGRDRPELAIMINCEQSSSCQLWLFHEVDGGFNVILRTSSELTDFTIKKTKSKEFFDIQTSYFPEDPLSETYKAMNDYKFDGKEYKHTRCSAIVNRYLDKNGDLRFLKKPRLEYYEDCC